MYSEDTIILISRGDQLAFNSFMGEAQTFLYRYAMGLTRNHEASQEIVSDVFYKVWKHRRDFPVSRIRTRGW